MKAITVYEAKDGSRWDDPERAGERDDLIAEIAFIMAPLGGCPKDPHCNFANGNGYVQHDAVNVAQVRAALLVPTKRLLKWWWDDQVKRHGKEPSDAHGSWYQRMLDGDHAPLDRAWSRFCCIDDRSREWGQQYYANNPDKGNHVEIKP